MSFIDLPTAVEAPASSPTDREKLGRKWLAISFIFCPCHLPVTMAVLGLMFGGSAFGALVGRNTLWVGIVFGTIYAMFLVVGFRHLRAATKGIDCSDGQCAVPDSQL